MRARWLTISACLLLLLGTGVAESSRKPLKQVKPAYPPLARQMNLHGAVTLQITISPAGKVTETKVLGGSPILIQSALDAVKNWTYESASAASTEIIKINFE